jgi:5-oxoprolinase (ATP-hydrolysing) subunit A
MRSEIDLNADIGECVGEANHDAELVPLLSSASIACGFHAGDPGSMAQSVALCRRHGVAIGAHPSYPDREGFGRRALPLSPEEIYHAVLYQVGALAAIAHAQQLRLAHVKPHGALYTRAAVERQVAEAIARAVRDADPGLALVGLANSALPDAARALGLRAVAEGFADRRYTTSGLLLSRAHAAALIEDAVQAEAQALAMVREGCVRAVDSSTVAIDVDTVCLHGDGAHALAFAHRLRQALAREAITVRCSWAAGDVGTPGGRRNLSAT